MQARVLYRTHYQVDEPALMELLVKRCTSAIRSAYSERVAEKLCKEVQSLGQAFNVPAARYALDVAHGLGLVNDQNVWTEKGHLVSLGTRILDKPWKDQLPLSAQEQLLHLRVFIEGDGATLLYLARYLLKNGKIPSSDEDWNALAKELFIEIYSSYLELAGTTADRVALRTEVDRIRRHGYKGKSGSHKMFIHLQTLYRLGLVDRAATATARQYFLPDIDDNQGLRTLVDEVRDLYALEEIIKHRRVVEICGRVLKRESSDQRAALESEVLFRLVVAVYREVMATGTPLAFLTTLIEAVQIELLITSGYSISYSAAQKVLEEKQRQWPKDVRFHVDRKGRPSFLKLSSEVLKSYGSAAPS